MIKFDCTHMENVAGELRGAASKLNSYADSLRALRKFTDEPRVLERYIETLSFAASQVESLAAKLTEAARIYREADRKSVAAAESLRIMTPAVNKAPRGGNARLSGQYAASMTIPSDLFVESWIMELLYTDL